MKLPRSLIQTILVLSTVTAIDGYAADDPEIVLNNANAAPFATAERDGFLDQLSRAMFARIGRRVRLVVLPPERGLRNANEGIEDGELARIGGIEKTYTNLMRVPERMYELKFSGFTNKPIKMTKTNGWKSLEKYHVGVIKGWKIAEMNLTGAKQVVFADDVDQLFRLLTKKRVDVVVYGREMGEWYLDRSDVRSVRLLEPALESRDMYMYLHKKHAALVPELAQALRAIKADGSYERLYRETIKRHRSSLQ